jgi:hypothetical protein
MDCTRVEELLALFSGGDLDARQTEAVRAHLVGCPACQAQADELATSRAWLQAAPLPQFDEAFYVGLRQSVLRELPQVETEGGRFAWLAGLLPQWCWQPVMALAATVLLLFAGWAVYRKSIGQPNVKRLPDVVVHPTPTMTPEQKKDLAIQPNLAPPSDRRSVKVSSAGAGKPVKRQPVETPIIETRDEPKAVLLAQTNTPDVGTVPIAPTPEPEMMRMEFQTADPNIRIIWLTPKAPATNPAEPLTK